MSWYEKLMEAARKEGKTRLINDRENKRLYLERLHLHPRWLTLWLFRANLHCIHASDDPADGLHDHPWPFITIILKGGYYEHLKNGERKWRKPGSIIFARSKRLHRLELRKRLKPGYYGYLNYLECKFTEETPCWTLFIMGPRFNKSWRFLIDGKFFDHKEWLRKREEAPKVYYVDVVHSNNIDQQIASRLHRKQLSNSSIYAVLSKMDDKKEDEEEHKEYMRSFGYHRTQNEMPYSVSIETQNDKALKAYKNYQKGKN